MQTKITSVETKQKAEEDSKSSKGYVKIEAEKSHDPERREGGLKLSKWTITQLHILLSAGGNKAFREFMDQYDVMHETIQKRYSTVAAQYYRDYLKNKVSSKNSNNLMVQQPDRSQGRERSYVLKKTTR